MLIQLKPLQALVSKKMKNTIQQLSVQAFAEIWLTNTETKPVLVDIREPWEISFASISGSLNIPMNQVPERLSELPKDTHLVLMCHHGGRSQSVAQFLAHNGFEQLSNLIGGIHAWSTEIDSNIAAY